MGCGHEKLQVYPAVIEYLGSAFRLCEGMNWRCNAKGFDADDDTDTDTDTDAEGKALIYSLVLGTTFAQFLQPV